MTQPIVQEELVERVARAICVADGKNPDGDWRDTGQVFLTVAVEHPEWWRRYEKHARAAIAALASQLPEPEEQQHDR